MEGIELMANTTVTSTTNTIKVDFGSDPNKPMYNKATYTKVGVEHIGLNGNHVEVVAADSFRWILSHETNSIHTLVIDSVNSVAPTSLSDLYDKLSALIE
jgi:hypothetical protein